MCSDSDRTDRLPFYLGLVAVMVVGRGGQIGFAAVFVVSEVRSQSSAWRKRKHALGKVDSEQHARFEDTLP